MNRANLASEMLRVLILAPTGRDGPLLRGALEEGRVPCSVGTDAEALCREAEGGAGALLVAEEALAGTGMRSFSELVSRQPRWSDLPLLLLTRQGADSPVLEELRAVWERNILDAVAELPHVSLPELAAAGHDDAEVPG